MDSVRLSGFIALQQEGIRIKVDGLRKLVRPTRLGLAQVSVSEGVAKVGAGTRRRGTPWTTEHNDFEMQRTALAPDAAVNVTISGCARMPSQDML